MIVFLVAATTLIFAGCSSDGTGQGEFTAGPNAKRYELTGTVVSVDAANKTAAIAHEEIKGFMEPMTMDFRFRDAWVWEALAPGAKVRADLVVDNEQGKSWLENVTVIEAPKGGATTAPRDDLASVGKEVPDFSLTDQDGKDVGPEDFKGKAWAITFIYTACPLPDYCILMSKHFSDLANTLEADEDLRDKIGLLTISFDPAKDTPEKLKSYGLGYLGRNSKATDFRIWKLAVGDEGKIRKIADFFGLRYEVDKKDKAHFIHSLRTIVIAPDGKVRKVFSGNEWTTDDLLEELKAAL